MSNLKNQDHKPQFPVTDKTQYLQIIEAPVWNM